MARPLSEEARQKALTAAEAVIAEFGIEGFTVDAVAKASGVAKTTIYRHWENRSTLLLSAIDCMIQPFPTPDTGSLVNDLDEFMAFVVPIVTEPRMRRTMMGVMAAAARDPELARVHHDMMQERMKPLVSIITSAKERGEIAADLDLELALDLIEGPLFFRTMVKRQDLDPAAVRKLIRIVARALAG